MDMEELCCRLMTTLQSLWYFYEDYELKLELWISKLVSSCEDMRRVNTWDSLRRYHSTNSIYEY
jgi:hypothetical protein